MLCYAVLCCAVQGNDAVFDFLQTVLDQVIVQFPYQYIHIGGDEVPKVRWEECDKCQARIQKVSLVVETAQSDSSTWKTSTDRLTWQWPLSFLAMPSGADIQGGGSLSDIEQHH
jgi:hypothetical protein